MHTGSASQERSPCKAFAGNASVVCLASILVVMSAGSATLSVLMAKQAVVQAAVDVEQAFLTAEAAVSLAVHELKTGTDEGSDGIGVVSGNIGRAIFATTIDPPFAGPGTYTVAATGRVGKVTRSVEALVERNGATAGFCGLNSVIVSDGLIDSYESSLGTYASQVSGTHAGSDVKVQSNGDISLSGSAMIHGDAVPGPTGVVNGAIGVTGSTAPATALVTMPPCTYAPPIPSAGDFSGTSTFGSGTYRFTTFAVPSGKVATFTGTVELYVDGDFTISGSGMGIMNPGAHVTIHQGSGTLTISGGGLINQDQLPSNLTINSATASEITVAGSADFHGTLQAPNAPLTATGGAGIYGSARVASMTLSGGTSLHADKNLEGTGEFVVRLTRAKGNVARRS